ncbi:MAG: Lrp/AsnC family transcriptional regulator [Pseudomonadota bacterium]
MPFRTLDRTDRLLLQTLSDDGRMTNTDIAEKVALSPSPCLRRVKRLESDGVIQGYGARLDPRKIGWEITAFIHLNIEKHRKSDTEYFRKELANMLQVVWCHALAGPWDMMLQVVARDLDDYYEVAQTLGELNYIKDIQSTIVIGEIKPNTGVPVPP